LRIAVKDVCPVIEFCDLRFEGEYKAVDLIIDYAQFSKYFIGMKTPINTVDLDNIEVKLDLGGNLINKGNTSDVMGNQWYALLWLVNAVLAQGGIIEPGHILITGTLGRVVPGNIGQYTGSWGPLGSLSWEIQN
jgi:2-keto-4-pentenoate hydratase